MSLREGNHSVAPPMLLAFAVLAAGMGTAIGDIYFAAFFAALILVIPLIVMPIELVLWGGMVLTFLVAGQLQYFANINKAFWLPYLFGAFIFVRLLIAQIVHPATLSPISRSETSPLVKWLTVFFLTALASTLINASPLFQVLVTIKEYLFLWSILIALAVGLTSEIFFDRMWKAVLWLVPFHLPVVLYQRFVVAAGRAAHGDAEGFDAVVGLFGGAQSTGGATGGMGIFLLFAMLLAISFWRQKRINIVTLLAICGISLLCIVLAEIKLIVLMIPVAVALMYRRDLLRNPGRTLVMLSVALVLTAALAAIYQWQYAARGVGNKGPFEYIEHSVETNTSNDFFNPVTGEIGRIASIKFWWQRHSLDEPVYFLIGHGIGASRYGTVMGEAAAKNLVYKIDRSSGVVYLWETGLLGAGMFLAFLISAAILALRLERSATVTPAERTALAAIAPMLVLQIPVLIYNNELNALPATQLLLMMMVGQVEFIRRRSSSRKVVAQAHLSDEITERSRAPSAGFAPSGLHH